MARQQLQVEKQLNVNPNFGKEIFSLCISLRSLGARTNHKIMAAGTFRETNGPLSSHVGGSGPITARA